MKMLVSVSSRSIRRTGHDVCGVSYTTRSDSILIVIIRCRKLIYCVFYQIETELGFDRSRARFREAELGFEPTDVKPNHPKVKSYELSMVEISQP